MTSPVAGFSTANSLAVAAAAASAARSCIWFSVIAIGLVPVAAG
jgi:hypothetical protein